MSEPDRDRVKGSGTADPSAALLRGGALPALVTGVVLVAGSAFAGASAMTGAAVGVLLAALAMTTGPLVMRGSRQWSPPAVMAIAVISYGVVVIVLGMVFLLLRSSTWLSPGFLGVGLIAGGAAWSAGELRAAWTLRVLAFGSPVPGPQLPPEGAGRASEVGTDAPGQSG
ncbi:MAG TPA: hypothetical protein VFP72_05040 [Kineosporiaceae bacterium]|nr:hypothetical protein [Kineosporiaceae bacterium]